MPPVLSLSSSASQIASYNKLAFLLTPFSRQDLPPFPPSGSESQILGICFKISSLVGLAEITRLTVLQELTELLRSEDQEFVNLLSQSVDCTNMADMDENDDSGEYLSSKKWELIDIKKKSDTRGRFHATTKYIDRDIRVFVSDSDQPLAMCNDIYLLPGTLYDEVLKSRYKDTAGEPLKVQNSGDVWMGSVNKNKFVKLFIKKVQEQ